MNEQHDTPNGGKFSDDGNGGHRQHRGRRWVKAGIAAAIVGAVAVAGISFARNADGCHGRFGMAMHGNMDPAMMSKHIDHMVDHLLADGTPEQKAKVRAIAKAAMDDLIPLRAQHRAAHEQAIKLLTQATIDREALEKLRVDQMRLADQASKRITQAVADAADVLTPEQRLKLVEHLKKRMG
jgi:Spy/CpxP family protein refolding chaperone